MLSALIVTTTVTRFVSFVNVQMWTVFANNLKRLFCIHQEIDRRLVHGNAETQVAIATADDAAHESHEVEGLVFNFSRRALWRVCSHSIRERMGSHKVLHSAAARCEALFTELGQEK